MKTSRRVLTCAATAAALFGCTSHAPPSERAAALTASVIASDRTEVVAYDNLTDDGLAAVVPVVIHYAADRRPSVAFRIDCGSNYGRMLAAFGYARDVDLDTVDRYASLDALVAALRAGAPDAPDVPVQTLRCASDEADVRRQIVQVFRVIDPDPAKGEVDYYVRLRDDPGAIYSLGCASFLDALAWPSAETVPVDHAVLETWREQGVTRREMNCYDAHARPMPPVDRTLPIGPPDTTPSDRAQLFRVRYKFDGIATPMPLYLISNGKGYALDCGSNPEKAMSALGFRPDAPVSEISVDDARFVDSGPGRQPNLRCTNPGATIFESSDQSPPAQHFRFGGTPPALFDFTCEQTRALFAEGISDVRKVPRASVPYLLVDPNLPDATTSVLRVGCGAHDECQERAASCAVGQHCVDTFLDYRCEACPAGFTSDGYTCRDIDECAEKTATCAPGTHCVNEAGGYQCPSWTFNPVYREGDPGAGVGGYNLRSTADDVFAFDYDHTGRRDHLALYRPGTGTFWIVKNARGVFTPVYRQGDPGNGLAGYDLRSTADRAFAFDYDGSGKLDHVALYRPGTGTFWIVKHDGATFTPVYREGDPGHGIGGYNLASPADQAFAFDYDGSGKLDHLALYRPGTGTFWILEHRNGQFTPVYRQGDPGSGIGGYNLLSTADRAFAFDYDGSGKLDHLALYRPGTGTLWILANIDGQFRPVFREGDPGRGIGGYDLRSTADRVFSFDYDGSGKLDHLALFRPGTGTFWIEEKR